MNKRLPEASLRSFGCLRFQSQLPTKVGTREKGREAHSLAGRGPEARGRPREGKLDRRRNPSPLTLDRVTSSMLKLCAAFPRILLSSPPPRSRNNSQNYSAITSRKLPKLILTPPLPLLLSSRNGEREARRQSAAPGILAVTQPTIICASIHVLVLRISAITEWPRGRATHLHVGRFRDMP